MDNESPFTAAVEIATDKDHKVLWVGRYQFSKLPKIGSEVYSRKNGAEYKVIDCIQTRGRYLGLLIELVLEATEVSEI